MKNVLFATTALVAFAGAASAETANIDFSGDMTVGYNDVIEGGLFWDGSLAFEGSVDLGDNVTATLEWELIAIDQNGWDIGGDIPTLTVAYDNGTMVAKLVAGDQDDMGASEANYSDRDGMAIDFWNWEDTADQYTASVEFGDITAAISCNEDCYSTSYGVSATFGSFDVAVGFDDSPVETHTGGSVDATFGAATIGASYITDGTDDSIGVAVGYEVSEALSVAAYYAMNSNAFISDAFGVSVDYTAGAMTVGAYYDNDDDGSLTATAESSYGVDVSYAVNDMLTANAGVFQDAGVDMVYYVGMDYAVNDNITATVSYATADEISGPEYKDGITALITASF